MAANSNSNGLPCSPPSKMPRTGIPMVPCQFVRQEKLASEEWLTMNRIFWKDPHGQERTWEAVERKTKTPGNTDGVVIIAVLRRMLKYDCVILVKQFRPPMKAYTLEFPAGLVDSGENMKEAALRELKEETGYEGTVKHMSPATAMDGGVENVTVTLVTAEIDGDDPINKKPEPSQDDSEFIEVLHLPISELLERINDISQEGIVVDSRVYTYAIALTQATKERKMEPDQK